MSTEWYYTTNKQQMGPVSWGELRELADGGILKPHDLVWTDGMDEWVKAINQQGLFAEGGEKSSPTKKSSYAEPKPPPGRRRRTEEEDEDDDEDEKEEKRQARKRQQERTQMAVGVKVGLILGAVLFVLLLIGCAGGLIVWLSMAGGGGGPRGPGGLQLNNTTWVGNETLQGFGRLEFQFRGGNQVTMVDAEGRSNGTFNLQGNVVTMNFGNGHITYTGTIQPNGRSMAGNARNSKNANWTFNVSR